MFQIRLVLMMQQSSINIKLCSRESVSTATTQCLWTCRQDCRNTEEFPMCLCLNPHSPCMIMVWASCYCSKHINVPKTQYNRVIRFVFLKQTSIFLKVQKTKPLKSWIFFLKENRLEINWSSKKNNQGQSQSSACSRIKRCYQNLLSIWEH